MHEVGLNKTCCLASLGYPNNNDYHGNVYFRLYLTISIFSIVFSSFLCGAYSLLKRFRRDCNISFVNQNLSYIAQSVNIMVIYAFQPYAISQYTPLITTLFLASSILSYVVVCVSRYTKSFYTKKHDTWCMQPRSSIIVIMIWLKAAVVAFLPKLGWGSPVFELIPTCSVQKLLYLVYVWIVLYVFPIVIFCMCHYRLFRHFRDRLSNLKHKGTSVRNKFRNKHQRMERNSIVSLVLYDFAFFICYTPLVVNSVVHLLTGNHSSAVSYPINIVVLLNNVSSPIFQGFLNKKLQIEVRKCFVRRNKADATLLRHKAFYERNSAPQFCFTNTLRTDCVNVDIYRNPKKGHLKANGKTEEDSRNTFYSTEHKLLTQGNKSTEKYGIEEGCRSSRVQFDIIDTKTKYKKYSCTPSPNSMNKVKDLSEELTEEEMDTLSSVINSDYTKMNCQQPLDFNKIVECHKSRCSGHHPRRILLPNDDSDYWKAAAPTTDMSLVSG